MISPSRISDNPQTLADWTPDLQCKEVQTSQDHDKDHDPRNVDGPMQRLSIKWRLFWQALKEAGRRTEKLPWQEQAKGQLWDFNKGQIRGLLRGLNGGLAALLNPSSSVHKVSLSRLHQELPALGEEVLDYGIDYVNADWEKRGEMSGESTVKVGLGILSLRNAYLGTRKMLQGLFK
jgi:hypothetical protein